MTPVDRLCRQLKAQGRRLTPQRRAIIQALFDDETHPTAEQILAARIRGDGGEEAKDESNEHAETQTEDTAEGEQTAKPINVVYVADIDLMMSAFMRIRARPDDDEEMNWRFENVNFLLNIVDSLSGDDDYVEIRRRKPYHT
ncbi:MAG: hypothetical protein ACK2UK_17715, partial [Candidatus Promineifilaceae bacterium]